MSAPAEPTSRRSAKAATRAAVGAKPKLLSGGNPKIAKAEGEQLVEALVAGWIGQAAALPGWVP